MKYEFRFQDCCNMCGSARHKVLGKRLNAPQRFRPAKRIGITTTVVRCLDCGLVYTNPLPVPEKLSDHYGVPPETYWHAGYFVDDLQHLSSQIQRFLALSGKNPTRTRVTALDIGAGVGKGLRALTRAGFDAFGIEPSEPFYRAALEKTGVAAERMQLATIEEASFSASSFDFVVFTAVLEHLIDPSAVMQRVVRWLTPGGLMVVEVPSADYLMSTLARWFYRATGADYVINTSPMHPPYHLYEFTEPAFAKNGRANGYRIVCSQFFPCQSYMPALLAPLFSKLMELTRTGMELEVWVQRHD